MKNLIHDDFFIRYGTSLELRKEEILHRPREVCTTIGRVESGKIRLSRILNSENEIVLNEFYPGEIFAELIVVTGENYPGRLIASEPSVVTEVKRSYLLEYLKEEDALISYLSSISHKVNSLTTKIEIASLKTVKQKIAYTLLSHDKSELDFPVSVSKLAQFLGCSREAVSRALTEMELQGMILRNRKRITIQEETLLEDLFFN